MHPAQKKETLRALEMFAYQIAYALLCDERKAAAAVAAAFIEVYRNEAFFRCSTENMRRHLKRTVLKQSLRALHEPERRGEAHQGCSPLLS